jgi:hypothetical protein
MLKINSVVLEEKNIKVLIKEYQKRGKFSNLEKDLIQFREWLCQDELYQYFDDNPNQQLEIYKDFQREKEDIKSNDLEDWILWATGNPKDAEKHYPIMTTTLIEVVKNTPPYKTANVIQNLPNNLIESVNKVNNKSGITRTKYVSEIVSFLNFILKEGEFETEIENNALNSVRDELEEQLKIWGNFLSGSEIEKAPPFYVQIGALFAQGFISKQGFNYNFKDEKFKSATDLSNHVQKGVLKTKKSVRQYINDTLNNSGQKNFYASQTMMNGTIKYCKSKSITVSNEFSEIYVSLKKH